MASPDMAMQIRHIKGYNGSLSGGLAAHPTVPGQLFYAVGSNVVAMFESNTLKQLQLRGHDNEITAFSMSPNGALLATGQKGSNSDVIIWNTQTLAQQFRFQEHDFEVVALAFSQDSRLLATFGNEQERRVFILDTSTGKIVTNTRLQEPKRTRAIAWSAQASGSCYTFATAADLDVYLWGVNPYSALIHCEKVTTGSVRRGINCLCFSADGAWLFAGTASGDILTINVARKAVQLMHTISGSGIGHLCLSPDKTGVLLAGTLDGSVCAFDFRLATSASGSSSNSSASSVGAGAQCVTAVVGYVPGPISSMAFTAGVDDLVVGTRSGDIFSVQLGARPVSQSLMQSQQGGLKDMCWDNRAPGSIITASSDGTVCVWEDQMLGLESRVALPNGVAALSCAASSQLLLSGWSDGVIHCHSRQPAGGHQQHQQQQRGGAALWTIPNAHIRTHATGVTALQLSNRCDFIASGGAGGELRVWDVASREMVVHLKHHSLAITDLKVLSDDAHLMAASEDRTWTIWDVGQERVTRLFRANMGAVRGLDMAPDQVTAVSVGLDKGVFFWDVRQDAPIRVVPNAHLHEITCCAINPQGSLVATGGADCMVKLWDLRSGKAMGVCAGHSASVNKLRFSPAGNELASVSEDGSMVIVRINV